MLTLLNEKMTAVNNEDASVSQTSKNKTLFNNRTT